LILKAEIHTANHMKLHAPTIFQRAEAKAPSPTCRFAKSKIRVKGKTHCELYFFAYEYMAKTIESLGRPLERNGLINIWAGLAGQEIVEMLT
jgi:hypothetical protein